jgi:sorting nexin-29
VDTLSNLKADITAIQEMRWNGKGCMKKRNCDIYYSCHTDRREFGCGFVVGARLRHRVSQFTPVNERLATIRVAARFFNISLICAHAPTEEKDDAVKDAFYTELDRVYSRCPSHDIKILLGDFNAKIGRESIFGATVGQHSLHESTSANGLRLIGFAAAHNMTVSSTRYRHLNIHKATWLSPDRLTCNQIDHVVIDARHASSILDVRSCRGPNIDSDHYLVAAKVRARLCVAKISRQDMPRKLDIEKLQSQQHRDAFSARLSGRLGQHPPTPINTSDMWTCISTAINTSAVEILGFQRPPKRNSWYDQECREATAAKNAAYRRTLQAGATRAVVDIYRTRRRNEKRLFRRKKQEMERLECEKLENSRSRNDARDFYRRVKRMTQGYKSGSLACRRDDGNLVTDAETVLRLWRDHFESLLAGDNQEPDEEDPLTPIREDGVEVPIPSHTEVEVAIKRLKNNKAAGADGLPAELFKAGGDELVRSMHQLICNVWLAESMPNDWNLSMICPILKKGDATQRTNYRGISLLPVAYKVLTSVMCERLKPYAEALIGPYQCGFRPGRSTVDQIFTLRQILEKAYENQIDTYHLFVDFKAAFDSPRRGRLYATMSELGIPAKLVRLCSMTLSNTISSVKVGNDLSETFSTRRGLRQGDSLSCVLFNLLMESVIRKAGVHRGGTILGQKCVQLLGYADDIDIIGRTKRDVTAAFGAIERESARVGLAVNMGKTKFMVCSNRETRRLDSHLTAGDYDFESVKDFVYLGTAVTSNNDVSLEIKRRITLANRSYFGLSRQMNSRALSRKTKLTLYKALIIPVLLYGAEAWTVTQSDAAALGVFERKILRKIFGPVCVGGTYRIRWNDELYELYGDVDIVKRINIQRLRWLGHIARMEGTTPARSVFDAVVGGQRRRGRPRARWSDQMDAILATLGITNWRSRAQDRGAWRQIVHQAVPR